MSVSDELRRAGISSAKGQSSYLELVLSLKLACLAFAKAFVKGGVLGFDLQNNSTTARAGFQPPFSGLHFDCEIPMLLQFPPEILQAILRYLEPIWIFQVEAAYPQIAELSASLTKLWYNALPFALYLEPEHFQVEEKFRTVAPGSCGVTRMASDKDHEGRLSRALMPSMLPRQRYFWAKSTTAKKLLVLPSINNLSPLAAGLDYTCDIDHPSDKTFYPFIRVSKDLCRLRNMAIGGPFLSHFDYRREIAGHLHYSRRCQICLELLLMDLGEFKVEWDVLFCCRCYRKYTLSRPSALSPFILSAGASLANEVHSLFADVRHSWS